MRVNRVGESNISNEGYKMTIKEYRSAKSIDVEFDDGTIRKDVQYSSFKSGRISKIPRERKNNLSEKRIGEENVAECGMRMRITAYRSATDIDIEFEDGITRKCIAYDQFKNGKVSRCIHGLWEIKRNIDGELMKIIRYNSSKDIDVEFSGGLVREGVSYGAFRRGTVFRYPLGEVSYNSNGDKMRILRFRNINDMYIESENGSIYRSIPFSVFKDGMIKSVQGLGEKSINEDGLIMSIIRYKSSDNIDVQFESGKKLERVSYADFENGSLHYGWKVSDIKVGEAKYNKCGDLMWITSCKSVDNITVAFADGRVRKRVSYSKFVKGDLE